jgi:hypothetical protein
MTYWSLASATTVKSVVREKGRRLFKHGWPIGTLIRIKSEARRIAVNIDKNAGAIEPPECACQGSGQLFQAGVVLMPFCLELSRHILKMIERDPRRPTLSAVVLLGFQSKANHVDRQKKITNLALKELISSTTTALFLLLSVCG